MSELSFARLRDTSVTRCESAYHPINHWSPTDWAGEVGEACNVVKKMRRLGGKLTAHMQPDFESLKQHLADELADTVIYADLLAERLHIDLGAAVIRKFNADSLKVGSPVTL